ncbi:dynein, axonemal, light chain 4a isoform X1 [Ictalurus punctatus]|uniref:Dynein light chain n=1 Tax=Ictalurus punctatus TaxID=7998 RepID=A0A2D0QGY1_ICTPU|nr:dynein, axonemal, light chain 4a isoform X1 [Ictalurus punctatus]
MMMQTSHERGNYSKVWIRPQKKPDHPWIYIDNGGQTKQELQMAETAESKKEEADYKRLHSFPLIRHTDMPEEMRVETMELCVTACEKFATNNESAAKMIKESMDKKFGSSWHVVIGEGFGFEVTHEVKNLLYMFFGGSLAVCVWKCS